MHYEPSADLELRLWKIYEGLEGDWSKLRMFVPDSTSHSDWIARFKLWQEARVYWLWWRRKNGLGMMRTDLARIYHMPPHVRVAREIYVSVRRAASKRRRQALERWEGQMHRDAWLCGR